MILHDPLHAMQCRPPPPPQVRDVRPVERPPPVDRDCPLHTAGDRCLWHAGGTAGENGDAAHLAATAPVGQRVRPVLGDYRLVGKSLEGSRQWASVDQVGQLRLRRDADEE